MPLVPKRGDNVKWYQMPFTVLYGLWQLVVRRKSVD